MMLLMMIINNYFEKYDHKGDAVNSDYYCF